MFLHSLLDAFYIYENELCSIADNCNYWVNIIKYEVIKNVSGVLQKFQTFKTDLKKKYVEQKIIRKFVYFYFYLKFYTIIIFVILF